MKVENVSGLMPPLSPLGTEDVCAVWYVTCWCNAWYLVRARQCQLALVISSNSPFH